MIDSEVRRELSGTDGARFGRWVYVEKTGLVQIKLMSCTCVNAKE